MILAQKQWRSKNKERISAASKIYRVRLSDKVKAIKRLSKYGLTQEVFDSMLEKQGGHCATCYETSTPQGPLHVDHDHYSGRVRGLLCAGRNSALGYAKENPERLEALATYIRLFS